MQYHARTNTPQSRGFTIVELLIVIVVIGILASITIVSYNGIQKRAQDTVVASDLANFKKTMELVRADNDGKYPTAFTKDMGFRFTRTAYLLDDQGQTLRYCVNPTTNVYIMYARSKSKDYFSIRSDEGVKPAIPGSGWGICYLVYWNDQNPQENALDGSTWADWVN